MGWFDELFNRDAEIVAILRRIEVNQQELAQALNDVAAKTTSCPTHRSPSSGKPRQGA